MQVSANYSFKLGLRGYHVYRVDWSPYRGENIEFFQEPDNQFDFFVVSGKVAVKIPLQIDHKNIDHVPLEVSRYIFYAIQFMGW